MNLKHPVICVTCGRRSRNLREFNGKWYCSFCLPIAKQLAKPQVVIQRCHNCGHVIDGKNKSENPNYCQKCENILKLFRESKIKEKAKPKNNLILEGINDYG